MPSRSGQIGQGGPSKLVSKAAFARAAGVSKQAVGKAALEGALKEAVVNDLIDKAHPAAVAYVKRNQKRARSDQKRRKRAPRRSRTDRRKTAEAEGSPETTPLVTDDGLDISAYADMTLRELEGRFGSVRALKEWLDALKKIEDIREKRLNNEEVQKQLISRELVKVHVMGFLEAGNRRLLGDASKTIARRLYALARADEPIEVAEKTVRDLISGQLEPQKKQAVKVLREAG